MMKMPIDKSGNIRYFDTLKLSILISFVMLLFVKTTAFLSVVFSSETAIITSVTIMIYVLTILIISTSELIKLLKYLTKNIFIQYKKTNKIRFDFNNIKYKDLLNIIKQNTYLKLNVVRC